MKIAGGNTGGKLRYSWHVALNGIDRMTLALHTVGQPDWKSTEATTEAFEG